MNGWAQAFSIAAVAAASFGAVLATGNPQCLWGLLTIYFIVAD